LGETLKRLISHGPLEFRVFQGKLYDYLATSNTLTVVYKGQKGAWNNWPGLQSYWSQEQAFYNKIQSESAKSTPYSL
ncbi:MAG: hypothetical protein ACAI44_13895, partial [Candidatus Sericytochromatia bacterium]